MVINATNRIVRQVQENQRLVRLQHLSESLGAGGSETIRFSMELLTQKGVKREQRGRGMSKDDPKTISQKSVLTDVMVLFSAIDAARAFAPSGPRLLEEASSCLPRESMGTGEKKDSQKEVIDIEMAD